MGHRGAFPGSRIEITGSDGYFQLEMLQHGLLRPLKAAKLSDGTLRYLLLIAALLSPRPPDLTILNEPEAGLHPDLLPPAGAAHRASRTTDADHRRLACGASRIGARTRPAGAADRAGK